MGSSFVLVQYLSNSIFSTISVDLIQLLKVITVLGSTLRRCHELFVEYFQSSLLTRWLFGIVYFDSLRPSQNFFI